MCVQLVILFLSVSAHFQTDNTNVAKLSFLNKPKGWWLRNWLLTILFAMKWRGNNNYFLCTKNVNWFKGTYTESVLNRFTDSI